jgi:hypothetical protein
VTPQPSSYCSRDAATLQPSSIVFFIPFSFLFVASRNDTKMDPSKYQQLQTATIEAKDNMLRAKATLDEVTLTLNRTKASLKESLSLEEQEHVQVTDTHLPELLERRIAAEDDYETWKQRYETNQKYLTVLEEKFNKEKGGC